ncbi:MAG: zinc finger domain-containing protein, partial [Phycisphaerae bacterium]
LKNHAHKKPCLAGRLQWVRKERLRRRDGCLELVFEQGWRLQMSEPGRRKQASVHLVRDPAELGGPSGLDPLGPQFTCQGLLAAARRRNRQLKGLLTDQREIAGIGNAYSDEILHAARLSPLQLTANLDQAAITRLHEAIVTTLRGWIDRISRQVGSAMPVNEQRWRRQMAVHGKYGQACGRCGQPIQRISYAETETHYCPTCQTGGRILADRRLSRLLR